MSTGSTKSSSEDAKCASRQENEGQQQLSLDDNIQNHLIDGGPTNSSGSSASSSSSSPSATKHQHHHQTHHQPEEPEQMRKLFIGGLDYKTSESTLKDHFDQYGDVLDCVVMREPQTKRSRGFGFVIYANSIMVDRAQNARPHEVDGREVQSKRAISREDSGKPEAQATVKKVYLGGLSDDIEESDLRDYFKEFGNIVNVNIVAHKDTGKRRGFAFVEYDDYDPVDKIVLKKFHTIKDKRIEAKKAIPKDEMDRRRVDPRSMGMSGPMMGISSMPMDQPGARSRGPRNSGDPGLWDTPYASSGGGGGGSQYASSYSSQAGYGYHPSHYHAPSSHYGASGWVMNHGGGQSGGGMGQHGSSGFRGGISSGPYGRSSYPGQPSGWSNAPQVTGGGSEYSGFPPSQSSGSGGPMRLNYQHRGWAPYNSSYGGSHRGRGYNQ